MEVQVKESVFGRSKHIKRERSQQKRQYRKEIEIEIEKEEIGYAIYGFVEIEEEYTSVEITTSFTIDCEVEQIVQ